MKKALITGITGQDGAYLADYLITKGYEVHGIKRRSSSFNTERIDHLYKDTHEQDVKLFLHYGDMTDSSSLLRIVQRVQPDEIYNLAAQSHVHVSFESPEYTANVDGLGTLRLLEAIKILGLNNTKFYQASTSELYGKIQESIQAETTHFYPRSPYAVAKLYAYWITVNYREAYDMYACNGILFNHESPLRGETFVTRKITRAVARILVGLEKTLFLGNLNAKRDWGHAKDYVEMQWLVLQQEKPQDYVIATGKNYSVREFVQEAFANIGICIAWRGSDLNEEGYVAALDQEKILYLIPDMEINIKCGDTLVKVDPMYFRPTEVDVLLGDSSKAMQDLGWQPKISFAEMVAEMVYADLMLVRRDYFCHEKGFGSSQRHWIPKKFF